MKVKKGARGKRVKLEPMKAEECEQVAKLIAASTNAEEGLWALRTLRNHFASKRVGIDDGRRYFTLKLYKEKARKQIIGVIGLHHYSWGPNDVVWLGWLAVKPEYQRKGYGWYMLVTMLDKAAKLGYKRIFVETYSTKDYVKARAFFKKAGFYVAGKVKDYLGKGKHMIVLSRTTK